MCQQSFADSISDALPGLHRFFYYHLRRNGVAGDIEQEVEDLIQVTTLKAFLNSKKKSLANYSNRSLLSIKAKNELANFYLRTKRQTQMVAIDPYLEVASPDPDPFERLVSREVIAKLQDCLEGNQLELFLELLDHKGYRQVAAQHKLTEAALKMRICRLRKQLIKAYFDSNQ
jgi:DNA-directed RNA polymerase specialized sigma24 family protein